MLKLERRRSSIEVIAGILRLGEASKAQMMEAVNLSYQQLQKHLNLLLKLKLVDVVMVSNHLVTYRATDKGLRLLRTIDDVLGMLEGTEPTDPWNQYEYARTAAPPASTM